MTLAAGIAWMESRLASATVRGVPVAFYRAGQAAAYSPTGTVGMLDGSSVTVLDADTGAGITVQAASVIVIASAFAACGQPVRGDACVIGARTFHVLPVVSGGPVCEPVDVYGNSVRVWLKEVTP